MSRELDWNAIKAEYITTNTSYRKLAKKYEIPYTTIMHRGKVEDWVKSKNQHNANIVANSVKKVEKEASNYRAELYALAYKVAQQMECLTHKYSIIDFITMGIKPRDITGAIKDLEDVLHVKSEYDVKEQEARIKKLQKEAETEDKTPNEIKITIEGGDESWGQ